MGPEANTELLDILVYGVNVPLDCGQRYHEGGRRQLGDRLAEEGPVMLKRIVHYDSFVIYTM